MMFLSFKLVFLGIVVSIITGAYIYITDLQNTLEKTTINLATSTLNQATLEKDIIAQKNVIATQVEDFKKISKAHSTLTEQNKKLKNEISVLDKKFNKINASGKKRDIGNLAIARTKAIEKVINRASNNAMRCLEIASGSPLTNEEKNATKKSQINSECPSIANPNYIIY